MLKSLRIALITDAYPPMRTSAALQMQHLAQAFVQQGHTPTVIVADSSATSPWCLQCEDGVEVLRLATPRTKDIGYVRRALAECALPFVMLWNLSRSPQKQVVWDGIAWYSPTIFFGPMVRVLKRRCQCRGYLILRDLFPDWAVDAGVMRRGLAYRFFKWVERYQYRVADLIGVQTPANLPLVKVDSPLQARIEVLNNWLAELPVVKPDFNVVDCALNGKTIFVYAGNMGTAQGMDCLIDLAIALQSNAEAGFLFVGRGSEVLRLRGRVAAAGLRNILFLDEVDSTQIPGLLAQCHIGLIALDPRHTTHNIPGKLLTYLHAGLPILARINLGNDLEALINDEGIGFVVANDDRKVFHSHALTLLATPELRAAMGQSGRLLAAREFSPAAAVQQIMYGLGHDHAGNKVVKAAQQ